MVSKIVNHKTQILLPVPGFDKTLGCIIEFIVGFVCWLFSWMNSGEKGSIVWSKKERLPVCMRLVKVFKLLKSTGPAFLVDPIQAILWIFFGFCLNNFYFYSLISNKESKSFFLKLIDLLIMLIDLFQDNFLRSKYNL